MCNQNSRRARSYNGMFRNFQTVVSSDRKRVSQRERAPLDIFEWKTFQKTLLGKDSLVKTRLECTWLRTQAVDTRNEHLQTPSTNSSLWTLDFCLAVLFADVNLCWSSNRSLRSGWVSGLCNASKISALVKRHFCIFLHNLRLQVRVASGQISRRVCDRGCITLESNGIHWNPMTRYYCFRVNLSCSFFRHQEQWTRELRAEYYPLDSTQMLSKIFMRRQMFEPSESLFWLKTFEVPLNFNGGLESKLWKVWKICEMEFENVDALKNDLNMKKSQSKSLKLSSWNWWFTAACWTRRSVVRKWVEGNGWGM